MITTRPGYHFTADKSGTWHICPDRLVGAVCNGTPRQMQAASLPDDAPVCRKCLRAGAPVYGYVPRCVECGAVLPEEYTLEMFWCRDYYERHNERRIRRHGTSLGGGARRTVRRGYGGS